MGVKDHKDHAEAEVGARCAIVVVSDSKTKVSDTSGKLAFELFTKFGHTVVEHTIVPNLPARVARTVRALIKKDAEVVLTIGGTGASRKDLTVEALRPLIVKEMPGFGELFRARSVAQIGTATILSRALLGITGNGRVVCCVPGSEAAVRLALEEILLNELKHLLWELRRYA